METNQDAQPTETASNEKQEEQTVPKSSTSQLEEVLGNSFILPHHQPEVRCIFFAASWCSACVEFTAALKDFYNKSNSQEKRIEVIWASLDQEEEGFNSYFEKMPWPAFRFQDPRIMELKEKFEIKGIPKLLVLDSKGRQITKEGRLELKNDPSSCLERWISQS